MISSGLYRRSVQSHPGHSSFGQAKRNPESTLLTASEDEVTWVDELADKTDYSMAIRPLKVFDIYLKSKRIS